MPHVLPSRRDRTTHRGSGPAAGLTDQNDRLAARNARRLKLRERMIDRAGDMSSGVFMRLADVDDGAGPLLMGLLQFLVGDGGNAGRGRKLGQQSHRRANLSKADEADPSVPANWPPLFFSWSAAARRHQRRGPSNSRGIRHGAASYLHTCCIYGDTNILSRLAPLRRCNGETPYVQAPCAIEPASG